MSRTTASIGNGTTLSVSDTINGTYTVLAELTDVQLPNVKSGTVDATHYTSPNNWVEKKSVVWKESDDISFNLHYNKTSTATVYATVGLEKYYKITLIDSSTYIMPGSLSAYGGEVVPNKDIIKQKGAITPLGEITFTAGS